MIVFQNEKVTVKFSLIGSVRSIIPSTVLVILIFIFIRFFICEVRWIPSHSMNPTLIKNDWILIERLSRFFPPQRGDIIIFYPPTEYLSIAPFDILKRLVDIDCHDVVYVKRVVGLPGDKLLVKYNSKGESFIYINGKKLEEKYVLDKKDYLPCTSAMYCGPITVPKNSYFMMGDNRGNSEDSRFWGFLPKDRIIGKAILIYNPLERFRRL